MLEQSNSNLNFPKVSCKEENIQWCTVFLGFFYSFTFLPCSQDFPTKQPNSARLITLKTIFSSQDMEVTWMSINRGMDKDMQYTYTMKYYSAIKKSKIMPFTATGMNLEIIKLNEVRHRKTISYRITHMWNLKFKKKKTIQMNLLTKQTDIANKLMVQFSRSVVSDSLGPHESQHARPPCPSSTPGVYSNSCPLSWWCHPAISKGKCGGSGSNKSGAWD